MRPFGIALVLESRGLEKLGSSFWPYSQVSDLRLRGLTACTLTFTEDRTRVLH